MKNEMNNGKIELCRILKKDSPWDKSLKAGFGRIDYNLSHCCKEEDLLQYCKENLSEIRLESGKIAIVEWQKAHTLSDNRGHGWGVATPTNTKATGRWRYAD
jgi:hypothetical protein